MKSETKPSIRINLPTKKKLEAIQSRTLRSQTSLLDRAVELLELETLKEQMEEDLVDLANDKTALAAYNAICQGLDGASGDGLGKE